jgi:FkbM family methyltransferase
MHKLVSASQLSLYAVYERIRRFFSKVGIKNIPGTRAIRAKIYRKLKPRGVVLANVQGSKMYMDTKDKGIVPYLLMYGVYEAYETKLFKQHIRPGDIVVDIGAHIGYYTLIAAQLVKPQGIVYAFEPDPQNISLLDKNIRANNYACVQVVPQAISNKRGKAKLFRDKVNLAAHTLSEHNITNHGADAVDAETTTLDEFFSDKGQRVDFIKMDVQGAEGLVLEGARTVLKNNRHLKITMEFWPYGLRNFGTDPIALLQTLQSYGFDFRVIDETHRCTFRADIAHIIEMCEKNKDGKGQVNLWCTQ